MLSRYCPEATPSEIEFSALHVPQKHITIINNVPSCYKFIAQLIIPKNNLISLRGVEQFCNLEVLDFDYNYVCSVDEFNRVGNKFFMRVLSFRWNPVQLVGEGVKKEWFVKHGFSRIQKVNDMGRQISQKKQVLSNSDYYHVKQASKRQAKSSKRWVDMESRIITEPNRTVNAGKIYYTKSLRPTSRNTTPSKSKQHQNDESSPRNPELRASTIRNNSFSYETQRPRITPFKIIEEEGDMDDETADFAFRERFGLKFLEQEKHVLAGYYYHRVLAEKAFKQLKGRRRSKLDSSFVDRIYDEDNVELFQRKLDNMKWGFLKMKNWLRDCSVQDEREYFE